MYLNRYLAKAYWNVPKKGYKWVTKPSPGPHALNGSIPLQTALVHVLKLAQNTEEAKRIVKSGKIFVDKKERKDPRYPVGLMDVVEIPSTGKSYRVVPDKRGLMFREAKNNDKKLCMISGKKTLKKGVFQLNLHDGRNMLVSENSYKPGDSILISLPDQKVLEHFKLEEGQHVVVVSGKNMGLEGILKSIKKRKHMREQNKVVIEAGKEKIETLKDYILAGMIEGSKK